MQQFVDIPCAAAKDMRKLFGMVMLYDEHAEVASMYSLSFLTHTSSHLFIWSLTACTASGRQVGQKLPCPLVYGLRITRLSASCQKDIKIHLH